MRGREFVFDCANELHFKLHKVDLNRGRSYINSPMWLKNKKATINPKNMNDNRYFQYDLTVALNYEKIKNHPERTKNIEPFIDQYSWDETIVRQIKRIEKDLSLIINQLLLMFSMFPTILKK